jgi:hypothetical protein
VISTARPMRTCESAHDTNTTQHNTAQTQHNTTQHNTTPTQHNTNSNTNTTQHTLPLTSNECRHRFLTGAVEWEGMRGDMIDLWPHELGAVLLLFLRCCVLSVVRACGSVFVESFSPSGLGYSFPAWKPIKRIDFMLMRGEGTPTD